MLGGSVDQRNKAQIVRERLGVTEEMSRTPKITHILMAAPGGLATCIEALRGDDDPLAVQFLTKYDEISESDLNYLTIEEISMSVEIEPRKLLGIITTALATQAIDTQRLIVAAATPKIIAKTVELASTNLGDRDREFFLKHISFIPKNGPAIVNNMQNNTMNALPEPTQGEQFVLPDPRPDAFLLELQSTLRPEQKRIEPPKEPIVIAEAEYVIEGDVR